MIDFQNFDILNNAHGLTCSFARDGELLTVKLSGIFNADAADVVRDKILSTIDGAHEVIFDLEGLEYITWAGMRILLAALKKITAQGGTLTLRHVGARVREILDVTGFVQIFNVEA